MARAVLETDRLTLREITPDDLPFLHRIFGDAECMQYYPRVKSFDETARWFQWLAFDSYASHGFGLWAVTDRQNGALLGDCGVTLQETSRGLEPEIGYHLWRDHWGKGYAVEAAAGCEVSPAATAHPFMAIIASRSSTSLIGRRASPSGAAGEEIRRAGPDVRARSHSVMRSTTDGYD
ncbi:MULTISPECIES: GNAT family N-acetyltransferase [unclassified Rhizobium]|uniref:GNAT family N-acetyltransferase n=1 Tax=unclassified Rhizobium TaxID=2613769 RepID=UPI000A211337|nr:MULTISPECIES: GNAT family N-acetyltransferase [unclassified Rhizobium]ARO23197.1 N-acetyltransferase family protein [Rhizobium sp. TAL182]